MVITALLIAFTKMRRSPSFVVAISTLVLLFGMAAAATSAYAVYRMNFTLVAAVSHWAAREKAIEKLEEEWNEAFGSRDVDALASMITDDFVAMPPNEPALVGKEAYVPWIREFLAGLEDENTNTESDVSTDEIVVDRDWAFVRATVSWATTPAAGGDPTAEGQVLYIHIIAQRARRLLEACPRHLERGQPTRGLVNALVTHLS